MADAPTSRHRDDEDTDAALVWRLLARGSRPWVGWVFLGIGALLILLGYLGVSREAIVAKQIPYLVSGGIGGVVLAVVGAYFLGTEELRKDSGRLDRLEAMVEELHAALLTRPDAPTNGNGQAPRASRGKVLAVAGGDSFHREGCALVEGKEAESRTPAAASKRGLQPCAMCEPATQPA